MNARHAIEDILEYVGKWPPYRYVLKRDVTLEVPYQSIYDFVNTCRQSGSGEDAAQQEENAAQRERSSASGQFALTEDGAEGGSGVDALHRLLSLIHI